MDNSLTPMMDVMDELNNDTKKYGSTFKSQLLLSNSIQLKSSVSGKNNKNETYLR
jgi:hypothetical protein